MPAINGMLCLHKPTGLTSRRVVDIVQRLVKPAKAGHAGTLDPLASGVLVVGVGQGTRLIEYVQQMQKQYAATFLLGRTSETEDIEGEVTLLADAPCPTREEIAAALPRFTGAIEQRPPAFSALKVAGRRSYDLARAGQAVELAARPIEIYRLEMTRYEYPELSLEIDCSSGTYVRSLGRDLARSLASDAVMSGLVRTAIGRYRLEDSIRPDELTRDNMAGHLLPLRSALGAMPTLVVDQAEAKRLGDGLSIARGDVSIGPDDELAAIDEAGQLLALLRQRDDGTLGPTRTFMER